jgi:hypothetical protein
MSRQTLVTATSPLWIAALIALSACDSPIFIGDAEGVPPVSGGTAGSGGSAGASGATGAGSGGVAGAESSASGGAPTGEAGAAVETHAGAANAGGDSAGTD